MRFLSLFSGIDAASIAWEPLGWHPAAFAQHDPDHKGKGPDFASAVLKFHHPDVPNLGDVTKADFDAIGPVDLVVFGSPCQSYSVAGKRLGLDDPRGNLALVGGQIVYRKRARWFVFENVPGLLSSDSGWDFGTLLAAFAGYPPGSVFSPPDGGWRGAGYVEQAPGGYGLAWRVLDSQFVRVDGFGRAVPQRRRRVFVVGYIGDWRRAAAVLFERAGMSGDSPPRRKAGQGVAGAVVSSSARRGGVSEGERGGLIPEVSPPLRAGANVTGGDRPPGADVDTVESLIPEVAHALRADGFDAGEDGTGRGTPIVPEVANPLTARMHKGVNTTMDEGQTMIGEPIAFSSKDYGADAESGLSPTLRAGGFTESHANGGVPPAIAFNARQDPDAWDERSGPLDTDGSTQAVLAWQNRFRGDDGRGYTRAPATMEDVAGTLDTVKPWHIASEGNRDASEDEADAISAMLSLREQIGAEAFTEWGLGVLDTLQPPEVLPSGLHGGGIRCSSDEGGRGLDDWPLSREERGASGAVRDLREAGRQRRAPFGRGLSEQFARELEAALSELPHEGAQAEKIVFCLRRSGKGIGVLQQALYPVQRGPAWVVRGLTPAECEKLQGFPPGFTNIPWRGRNGDAPDGPRYKVLGNSMSVNVMRWIGVRIEMVEDICNKNIDIGPVRCRITP